MRGRKAPRWEINKTKPPKGAPKGCYFSQAAADHAVNFIQALKHTKGKWAGLPFLLLPWQRKIIEEVFGWLKPNGYRLYTTVYIEIPKKNGKSETAAASEPQPVKTSEPQPKRPSEANTGSDGNSHRFYIRPAALEKLERVSNYGPYLTPVTIEVYSLPRELVEERPDLVEGMLELKINE